MNELLTNPAFQSGVLPFFVAFIAAVILSRLGWIWAGLGFIIAYSISIQLTVGFQFTPLTSTRKIILFGLLATLVGLVVDAALKNRQSPPNQLYWLLTGLAIAAVNWMIWPVASRLEGSGFWFMIVASSAYIAWLVYAFAGATHRAASIACAGMALGFGTGVSALLGASALLGQLGIATGAICVAFVLFFYWKRELSVGYSFSLPLAMLTGLIGTAGVIYARLPWYSLIPLAAIPLLLYLPGFENANQRKSLVSLCLICLVPAGIAIAITWNVSGAPPI